MIIEHLEKFIQGTGWAGLTLGNLVMVAVALVLIYLAIKKQYEPYLLIPIGFGVLLANIPLTGLMEEGGLLYYLHLGVRLGIYPPLIFLGVGAMTDFGPLIANPVSVLLGAAAQIGIFLTFLGAIALNFSLPEAGSIGIIGGADGPTAIFLTSQLAPELLGAIAIAAYSYMALVPIIQPPIIRLLTSSQQRKIRMEQLREVSQRERIVFPILVTFLGVMLVPSSGALLGALMLGNLLREAGVVERLSKAAQSELINIVTIFLGVTVGATAAADRFLTIQTVMIVALGLVAFAISTAGGVLFGQLCSWATGGKMNPMLGAAGVSAVPMAARVVHRMGTNEDRHNYLLMHAMGPNVAGLIGSAIAAGILLSILG